MKQVLIIQIVFILVLLYVNRLTWVSCTSGCKFFSNLLIRLVRRHFLTNHYLGFVFAI